MDHDISFPCPAICFLLGQQHIFFQIFQTHMAIQQGKIDFASSTNNEYIIYKTLVLRQSEVAGLK